MANVCTTSIYTIGQNHLDRSFYPLFSAVRSFVILPTSDYRSQVTLTFTHASSTSTIGHEAVLEPPSWRCQSSESPPKSNNNSSLTPGRPRRSTEILEYLQRRAGLWPPGGDPGNHVDDLHAPGGDQFEAGSHDVCGDALGPAEVSGTTERFFDMFWLFLYLLSFFVLHYFYIIVLMCNVKDVCIWQPPGGS